jgi:hypothetical protein
MATNELKPSPRVSYLTLRKVVGALGVLLPVIVAVWGFAILGRIEFLESISDYYGLRTRDAFVGILFVIAWYLFAYKGHDRRDDLAGDLACVFALGVALFPTGGGGWESFVHFTSALLLFLVLAYFRIYLFTESKGGMTPEKRLRNRVYRACGGVILVCLVLIGLFKWGLLGGWLADWKPVFWLEAFALWAFGFSWFVKGETLWKDQAAQPA